MAVSILLVGPVGSRNGQIEMRRLVELSKQNFHLADDTCSVHSRKTSELIPLNWPLVDPDGF